MTGHVSVSYGYQDFRNNDGDCYFSPARTSGLRFLPLRHSLIRSTNGEKVSIPRHVRQFMGFSKINGAMVLGLQGGEQVQDWLHRLLSRSPGTPALERGWLD